MRKIFLFIILFIILIIPTIVFSQSPLESMISKKISKFNLYGPKKEIVEFKLGKIYYTIKVDATKFFFLDERSKKCSIVGKVVSEVNKYCTKDGCWTLHKIFDNKNKIIFIIWSFNEKMILIEEND